MLNTLATSRMLKHANKSKISYGNLKVVSPEEFCTNNNITIEQLATMAPDYKELDLLVSVTCYECNEQATTKYNGEPVCNDCYEYKNSREFQDMENMLLDTMK